MNSSRPSRPMDDRVRTSMRGLLAVLGVVLFVAALAEGASPADPPAKEAGPKGQKWQSLFDGKKLGKWKVIEEFDFSRHGKVHVREGQLVLEAGKPATGVKWTGPFPKIDYEVTFEAMRVEGEDFFCGMTFPVGKSALTLVLGGWGGSVVGLSSIDGEPAVENETCLYCEFDQRRWYSVRLRVTGPRIEVWAGKEKWIDLTTEDRKFTIYWEMEPALPFGVATWHTTGALRNIRVRPIQPKPAVEKPPPKAEVPEA
ncbi:MAG: DUF1080 domain-containing protein [Planctomycetes bacterium]|nr:DUF1080 domain-containing protein [Planctomycetota bacterium]